VSNAKLLALREFSFNTPVANAGFVGGAAGGAGGSLGATANAPANAASAANTSSPHSAMTSAPRKLPGSFKPDVASFVVGEPLVNPESIAAAPQPRKRRTWLKVLGGVLLLIVLLVVFAPTIAGTALVRNYVTDKINEGLNGNVEIRTWRLGWTGGVDVHDVKV